MIRNAAARPSSWETAFGPAPVSASTPKGEPGNPVPLEALTPGRVVLTATSRLRLAGKHRLPAAACFAADGLSRTSSVSALLQHRRSMRPPAGNQCQRRLPAPGSYNYSCGENVFSGLRSPLCGSVPWRSRGLGRIGAGRAAAGAGQPWILTACRGQRRRDRSRLAGTLNC